MKTPKIQTGIMMSPIMEQLKEQDIEISEEDAKKFERVIAAINMLYLHRIMTKEMKAKCMGTMMMQLSTLVNMDELIANMAEELGKKE